MCVLDTCVLSDLQRGVPSVVTKIENLGVEAIALTAITILEVLGGWQDFLRSPKLSNSQQEMISIGVLDSIRLFNRFQLLPFTAAAIERFEQYKKIKPGINVRGPDLRIGCIAIETERTVVTYNVRDFKRIPHLKYLEWSAPQS
jgi:tRNA(fMet)-specific endonuclease VapC